MADQRPGGSTTQIRDLGMTQHFDVVGFHGVIGENRSAGSEIKLPNATGRLWARSLNGEDLA